MIDCMRMKIVQRTKIKVKKIFTIGGELVMAVRYSKLRLICLWWFPHNYTTTRVK